MYILITYKEVFKKCRTDILNQMIITTSFFVKATQQKKTSRRLFELAMPHAQAIPGEEK